MPVAAPRIARHRLSDQRSCLSEQKCGVVASDTVWAVLYSILVILVMLLWVYVPA